MNLGMGEIVVGIFLLLLLFGGKRLPALGKSLGQSITNFKKGLKGGEGEDEDNNNGDNTPT